MSLCGIPAQLIGVTVYLPPEDSQTEKCAGQAAADRLELLRRVVRPLVAWSAHWK